MAVYGFPEERYKARTWDLVRRAKPPHPMPWLCIGDFNDIISPADKLGGDVPDMGRLQVANQACNECDFHDVGFSGYRFTWSNMREAPNTVEERLDFALANSDWSCMWPVTKVRHFINYKSDHCPIVLTCSSRRGHRELARTKLFRFEELWLQSGDECSEVVAEAWSRTWSGDDLHGKFEAVSVALGSWGKQKFGDIPKKISDLKVRLQNLQRKPKTEGILREMREAERELDVLLEREEIWWSQRSRANWLKHGDRNTRFFHQKASQRRKWNLIEVITDSGGREVEDDAQISQVLREYFESLFTSSNPSGIEEVTSLVAVRTLLVLIPKIKEPLHAAQYRPISLCNVLFKIITKTIANRLKLILPDLISNSQSAFVPGRLITDNALIAHECFHYMKKKITGWNGMMALKLDMSKAYDRVEWNFLQAVLSSMGFPTHWVTLIMNCVSSVDFSIMLNGNPQPVFSPLRGLRQGDPLSPYLFILCGEVFSALIQRSIYVSSLHGIKIAKYAPVFSHLLFADDGIIFAKATNQEAEVVKTILTTYERASRQMINLDKSMLLVSRNVPQNRLYELKQLLGVKAVESFDRYLGLPTIFELESMISRFYWGGNVSKRGIHWSSWSKLCRSKCDGGLGFRDLHAFNMALVAKNWWRIYSHPESLFAQIFKGVYFPHGSMLKAKKGWLPSYAWSSIWSTKWTFETGARWKIGNGQMVDVRHDNWLPHGTPIIYSEDLLLDLNITYVSDLLLNSGKEWNRELVEHVFCPNTALQITSLPLSMHGGVNDSLFWPGAPDGLYSSKLGYSFIRDHEAQTTTSASMATSPLPAKLWQSFWKTTALSRCKDLAWRVFCSLLLVRDSLWRKGVNIDPSCPLCGYESETVSHLWLHCPVSKCFWFAHPLALRLDNFFTVTDFLLQFLVDADSDAVASWQTASYALWEARN
ncbi:uncharacterized protein LOC130719745 [Lotus japonicus]|uniref:uncharacterized protein LOC130719745 n=1 Tax=Lotus japonicus TaxID=34305 RepID=UPI00258C63D2|nr:uncharacterized protein LOC130719745 [Lotus japonicus]